MRKFVAILLFGLTAVTCSHSATPTDRHVVLVVWDGMRPDFINPTNTPTLSDLASRGTFFAHHHPVYVSSTEVNGTALSTGAYPEHSSVIGNREYRPGIDLLQPIAMESLDAMRKGDLQNGYLKVPTMAELLQKQGYRTTITGTKPVVLLFDRAARGDNAADVVLFEGRSLPAAAAVAMTNQLGPFFDRGVAKTNRDVWTARGLTESLWSNGVPALSVLWLAEPDATQHALGVGSPAALAAIRNSDHALSMIIDALKAKGVWEKTDILVVSDHGFSTISTSVDIVQRLQKAGFRAGRRIPATPATGDVLLVGLGGSVFLYVTGHDEKTIEGVVRSLQTESSVGAIFTARGKAGTFALKEALIASPEAPDIVFSFRWTTATNGFGAPGTVISEFQGSNISANPQRATHASLSPFDMHNTLVAAGPDVRAGFVDELPSGNEDVAPTIMKLLGAKAPSTMNGRVLTEALNASTGKIPALKKKQLRAHTTLPTGEWTQTLDISEVNGVRYLDQGTGEFAPK